MVRNSGQGPGGSPVPRVLMIAGFCFDSVRKGKCRRRGRGMLLLLEEEEEEKRIILTVATTCRSLSSFTLLHYCCCCCCNGRRAGQCEEEEYTGMGGNHFVLEDFFCLYICFLLMLLLW